MKTFEYVVKDELGLHARPAGLLVKKAGAFASKVMLSKDGKSADAKRIMAVMALGVKQGNTITVSIEGDDEETAASEIETFLNENL